MSEIVHTDGLDSVEPGQLEGFLVGWPNPPSPERHLDVLRGSAAVVLAREWPDGRVVGFVTAVGDRVLGAYIPLLEVLPVDLCCDAELEPFYQRVGLETWDRGTGIRNYEAQPGRS